MSIIGSLETFNLLAILQRVESHAKTGLLIVKQGERRVELYFRQGQLVCIGPVNAHMTLGDRLLQAGVISQQALQEARFAIGAAEPNEMRMALTFIDLGYLNQERLYNWATKEASQLLHKLLNWKTGEVSFEEELSPPVDRLLIALSVGSLMPAPVAAPQSVAASRPAVYEQARDEVRRAGISDAPTLFVGAQFFPEPEAGSASAASLLSSGPSQVVQPAPGSKAAAFPSSALTPPKRVGTPQPPRRIDTSFMHPHMVLVPADLSALRQQNPEVQLTPEQWRLLARTDGRTSLQMACQALAITSDMVCQVAGELIALGLITATFSPAEPTHEALPTVQGYTPAGVTNRYVPPALTYGTMPAKPSAPMLPSEHAHPLPAPVPAPIETQSQWGNGGNGARFVLGGGWVLASQSAQSTQTSGPLHTVDNAHTVYANVGGGR